MQNLCEVVTYGGEAGGPLLPGPVPDPGPVLLQLGPVALPHSEGHQAWTKVLQSSSTNHVINS